LGTFFTRITLDERLFAIGFCAGNDGTSVASKSLPPELRCKDLGRWGAEGNSLLDSKNGPLHVSVQPMVNELYPTGRLVLVHDLGFVTRRSEETKRYLVYGFLGLAAVVSLLTVIIAQLSWRGWLAGMRSLLRGEGLLRDPAAAMNLPEFRPIARDMNASCASWKPSGAHATRRRSPGRPSRCAPSCAANCAAKMSSWFPTASPTSTSATASASRCSVPPAAW
jgi:hypothetical protein